MKKKIREMTQEDFKKICIKKHKEYNSCYDCPLKLETNLCFLNIDLDQEIEVEENGKETL